MVSSSSTATSTTGTITTDANDEGIITSETTPLLSLSSNNSSNNDNGTSSNNNNGSVIGQKHGGVNEKTKGVHVPVSSTPSAWSKLVFSWFTPILEKGNKEKVLNLDDLDLVPMPNDCSTVEAYTSFEYYWQQQQQKQKTSNPSVVMALIYSFGTDFVRAAVLKLIHDLCLFVGPQILKRMIHYLREPYANDTKQHVIVQGLLLTTAVTISQVLMSLCLRHYFFKCYTTGLRIRTALTVAIYQKALLLSSDERQTRSIGEITNLMSIDTQRLQDLTTYLNSIWSSPLQILLALYFLWNELGVSSLGGVAIIAIMIPVTKNVSKWMGGMQKKVMKARDLRVELNNEVLSGMKVIKFQAWEVPFQQRLTQLRQGEMKQLFTYYVGSSFSKSLWTFTPLAVAVATFGVYVALGNNLDVATALTSLALFDILRFPLFMLPQVINNLVESYISLKRVQSFLLCTEHHPIGSGELVMDGSVSLDHVTATYGTTKQKADAVLAASTTIAVDMTSTDPIQKQLVQSTWEASLLRAQLDEVESLLRKVSNKNGETNKGMKSYGSQLSSLSLQQQDDDGGILSSTTAVASAATKSNLLCLKRITMECQPGQFIAIVGGVGSGKSTVINSILGEVSAVAGTISVKGKLAYFSQSPFIMNASVRDNILFGHCATHSNNNDDDCNGHVDEDLYQRSLDCCALRHDLQLLPDGDETEIGEKGITLSGGQKARIALARAVYHNADITLIDDALSAVDAHVAKHLFEQALLGELLQNNSKRPQQEQHQRSVILVTNALQYLNHPRVDKIIVVQDGRIIEEGKYRDLVSDTNSVFARYMSVIADTSVSDSTAESIDADKKEAVLDDIISSGIVDTKAKLGGNRGVSKLVAEETRETGHVGSDVYMTWANAAGGIHVPILFIIVFVLVESTSILSNWWLTYWSQHGGGGSGGADDTINGEHYHSQAYFLLVYTAIVTFVVLAGLGRMIFISYFGLRASGKLFSEMLETVLHAKMSFFDTTPVGRLVNRFSKDIYTTDERLSETMRTYLSTLFSVISTIVVITSVTPIFAICLIPMIIYYMMEQAFFTLTYRELKRLDSIARSPIYALLGESVDGAAVIRAFGAQETLFKRMISILDKQQHAYFLTCAAQSWLAVRLELVANLVVTFACASAVLQHTLDGANTKFAGLAGLAISYSLSVTQSLNWSVRMASDLEAAMVSVERIREYSLLESEGAQTTNVDNDVRGKWPISGQIEFKCAKLRYRPELPLVLKGLDLTIPGGSKVGVVGRTGAGKSTLMVSLMRIVELYEGKIFIDGVDTSTLGLSMLRSNIAVIPQDPVLFSGTVRSNLDPFDDHTDEVLLGALERVGLYKPAGAKMMSSDSLTSMANARVDSLDNAVSEGGSNFSVGQRQLLVIARALLRGTKIVIMDEATASIDAETDAMIQKVLRTAFNTATCLTVAHRLNTIMDSDYILVMDDGKAAEFDTPTNLLTNGGMFRDLVQAASR